VRGLACWLERGVSGLDWAMAGEASGLSARRRHAENAKLRYPNTHDTGLSTERQLDFGPDD